MRLHSVLAFATLAVACACSDSTPTVPPSPAPVVPTPVSLRVDPGQLTLVTGTEQGLRAELVMSTGEARINRDVVWTSSDSSVAVVNSVFDIQAFKPGAAILTAHAVDSRGLVVAAVSAEVSVTVLNPTPVSIAIDTASVVVTVGTAAHLSATVLDYAGRPVPNATVSWASSDPSVAAIDANGTISGLSTGTVLITASFKELIQRVSLSVSASPPSP